MDRMVIDKNQKIEFNRLLLFANFSRNFDLSNLVFILSSSNIHMSINSLGNC
jgi:hypothetical protein